MGLGLIQQPGSAVDRFSGNNDDATLAQGFCPALNLRLIVGCIENRDDIGHATSAIIGAVESECQVDDDARMLPRALLFDMDGTLTTPMLDFPQIKAEMGIGDRPILEALAQMNSQARTVAEAVLHRHEERAAVESTLNPGCTELINWINKTGMSIALITRNTRKSVNTVLNRHGLKFEVLVTRDDCVFKPDPTPLRLACERLKVTPEEAWMIGDGRYDIEAGLAAGIRTVWLSHGRTQDFPAQPWRVVSDLHELFNLLTKSASI